MALGLRTAWSDKHEVYASFNGPGSNSQSIDDRFRCQQMLMLLDVMPVPDQAS
jgi:hypothetical protein